MPQLEGTIEDRRLIALVRIRPPLAEANLDGLDVHALIDTGATSSGVTHRVIDKLGLPLVGKRPLGSALGDQQVAWHLFGLAILQGIGADGREAPFVFDDRAGFALRDGFRFDALIGMDVLEQCDLTVARNGSWNLAFGR